MNSFVCIYFGLPGGCHQSHPPNDEHVLPRGLGVFRGDERLKDKICKECNSGSCLGKLDDVFLHSSPEAIVREVLGNLGRKRHRRKSIHGEGSHGIPPIAMLGSPGPDMGDIRWESNPDRPFAIQPMLQVIFVTPDGERLCIPISKEIRAPQEFDNYLAQFGCGVFGNARLVEALIASEDIKWFREIARHYFRGQEPRISPRAIPIGGEVSTVSTITLSPLIYRAIAKIGFHFLLEYGPSFTGFEPQFDTLKGFIIAGSGEHDEFLSKTNEPKSFRYRRNEKGRWMHVFGLLFDGLRLTVDIAFFVGTMNPTIFWEMVVDGFEGFERFHSVYAYAYWDRSKPVPTGGCNGELIPLGVSSREDLGLFLDVGSVC